VGWANRLSVAGRGWISSRGRPLNMARRGPGRGCQSDQAGKPIKASRQTPQPPLAGATTLVVEKAANERRRIVQPPGRGQLPLRPGLSHTASVPSNLSLPVRNVSGVMRGQLSQVRPYFPLVFPIVLIWMRCSVVCMCPW
jgi:hypothetical protein